MVDSSDDAIVTNSQDAAITSWNRAAERLYGYTAEEAIGRSVSMIEPPDREGEQAEVLRRVFAGETVDQHLESERVRKDGSTIVVSLTISPVRDADDKIVSVAVIARDITEQKRDEDRLRHLAEHDQLTGLVNRRRFDQELKRELAKAGRYHSHSAVLSVDIDNFKAINDSAGHAAGDAVLAEVADVLSSRFRSTDVVARLGGDEFGVLVTAVGIEEARAAADDLLGTIRARLGAVATRRPPPLAMITVAGCLAFAAGTKAALRSRWRTACAASEIDATGRMSNAEPAAFSMPARSGAVRAAGPTTPTVMPFGCGLWYVPMMQAENMTTKKRGMSIAPSASRVCARCSSCAAALSVSFGITHRSGCRRRPLAPRRR